MNVWYVIRQYSKMKTGWNSCLDVEMGMPTAFYTLASIRSISNYRHSNFDSDEYLKRLIRLASDMNTSDWLTAECKHLHYRR